MSLDHRQLAQAHVDALIARLEAEPGISGPIIDECAALSRAIGAFHMEGIRFRMYNVDRLFHKDPGLPAEAVTLFADARRELEAAGFHTRSHQAPTRT